MAKKPKLTEATLATVQTAYALGLTDRAVASLLQQQHGLKYSVRTIQRWRSEGKGSYPAFRQAAEDGFAMSERKAARVAWESMDSDDPHLRFKAAVYWENSRHGRGTKIEQDVRHSADESMKAAAPQVHVILPSNGREGEMISPRPSHLLVEADSRFS